MSSDTIANWFAELQRIWLTKEISSVKNLLADTFQYFEHPMMAPLTAWEEVKKAWQEVNDQTISKLEITPLIVKDNEGTATYLFIYTDQKGNAHYSSGVYYVKLNNDGKAVEFKQWWVSK